MEEFVAAVFDDEYARRVPPKSSLPPPRLLLLLLLLLALDDDKGEVVFEGLVEEVAGMTPHALREKRTSRKASSYNEKKKPLRERETFLGYHLIMKVEGHYLLFLPVCFESINITRAARTHKHIFSCL